MKKRLISLILVLCMACALLAACDSGSGSGVISSEDAQKIVLKDLGVSASDAEMHVHAGEVDGTVCYSIYVTVNGETLAYMVSASTGEILSVTESDHSH